MANNKGLSDIVSAILFILIILIAIGLIWFFVRPFIVKGSQESSLMASCLTIDVQPTQCTYVDSEGNYYVSVRVKRGADRGAISGLRLVFSRTDGSQIIKDWDGQGNLMNSSLPNELENVQNAFVITGISPDNVGIAALVGNEEKRACSLSSVAFKCTPFSGAAACPDVDDGSGTGTRDWGLTIDDLLYYLTLFSAKDARADVGPVDGVVTAEDLQSFLRGYEEGTVDPPRCPPRP